MPESGIPHSALRTPHSQLPLYVRVSRLFATKTREPSGLRLGVAHRDPECHGARQSRGVLYVLSSIDPHLYAVMTLCRHCCGERKTDACPASS